MNTVITIYEARTNLSKYIKKAEAGQTIYIGAFGKAQAVIAPLPAKKRINIGVWAGRKHIDYGALNLAESDPDITAEFEKSLSKPL